MIKNFITAVQFLTIITVRRRHEATEGDLARSIVFFPVVGFLIGVVLVYADKLLSWVFPDVITNVLLILISVIITRAIHIDGLADTLDGLMGGADRESRLAIMKDSRLGTAGALGIFSLLLLKYLSLNSLFNTDKAAALLTAPMIGRWSQLLMMYRAAYGRGQGMGGAFVGHMRSGELAAATAVTLIIFSFVVVNGLRSVILGSLVLATAVIFTLAARRCVVRKFGGVTGDAVGAASELNEALALLVFVALSGGL